MSRETSILQDLKLERGTSMAFGLATKFAWYVWLA